MEEVKYIPGDMLVNRRNTVLRLVDMVSGMYYTEYQDGSPGLYISRKDILPIPLTPTILENSGWETQNKWYYFLDINKYSIRHIGIDFIHKSPKGNLYVEINGDNVAEIQYCHQLQHLLFGLNLNSKLKI